MEDSERFDRNFLNDLYRIIKEILNNVIKHSGASRLDISILFIPDRDLMLFRRREKGITANLGKIALERVIRDERGIRLGLLHGAVVLWLG